MNDRPTEENGSEIVKCRDIQELLLDYANRELGESRSALVREHLLYCEKCQTAYRDITETVAALQKASAPDDELPDRLSEKHYKRIIRALTHPILDWIAVHHKVVAIVMAVAVLVFTMIVLKKIRIKKIEKLDMGYEVYIQHPPSSTNNANGPIIIWRSE